jgi:hypothetical protein
MRAANVTLLEFASALLVAMLSVQTCLAEDAAKSGLQACAKLAENELRLNCYDHLAKQLVSDRIRPPAPVSAPEMFGAHPPEPENSPGGGIAGAELKSISAHITALRGSERAGAVVDLDNGQQWQQIGHEDLMLKVGDRVKISRGAFDGFWLMTEGNRLAHVKRVL